MVSEAEWRFLGVLFGNQHAFSVVERIIAPRDFTDWKARQVFEEFLSVHRQCGHVRIALMKRKLWVEHWPRFGYVAFYRGFIDAGDAEELARRLFDLAEERRKRTVG